MFNQIFCHRNNDIQNQVPLGFFGSEKQNGGIEHKHIVMQWP